MEEIDDGAARPVQGGRRDNIYDVVLFAYYYVIELEEGRRRWTRNLFWSLIQREEEE